MRTGKDMLIRLNDLFYPPTSHVQYGIPIDGGKSIKRKNKGSRKLKKKTIKNNRHVSKKRYK